MKMIQRLAVSTEWHILRIVFDAFVQSTMDVSYRENRKKEKSNNAEHFAFASD